MDRKKSRWSLKCFSWSRKCSWRCIWNLSLDQEAEMSTVLSEWIAAPYNNWYETKQIYSVWCNFMLPILIFWIGSWWKFTSRSHWNGLRLVESAQAQLAAVIGDTIFILHIIIIFLKMEYTSYWSKNWSGYNSVDIEAKHHNLLVLHHEAKFYEVLFISLHST